MGAHATKKACKLSAFITDKGTTHKRRRNHALWKSANQIMHQLLSSHQEKHETPPSNERKKKEAFCKNCTMNWIQEKKIRNTLNLNPKKEDQKHNEPESQKLHQKVMHVQVNTPWLKMQYGCSQWSRMQCMVLGPGPDYISNKLMYIISNNWISEQQKTNHLIPKQLLSP